MLWKDKYAIGVEEIDKQHKELFDRVYSFIETVQQPIAWEEKIQSIYQTLLFMKNYVIEHFDAEEKLQLSIGYPDYTEHKKLHNDMIQYVLDFEKKFAASQQPEQKVLIQEFSGKLLAWLLYHVVATDQKIAAYVNKTKVKESEQNDPFTKAILSVLQSMFQVEIQTVTKEQNKEDQNNCVSIGVKIIGDKKGQLVYHYTKIFAVNVVKSMCGMEVKEFDTFTLSALCEISNIISGHISSQLYAQNFNCDITPPEVLNKLDPSALTNYEWRHIHTNLGNVNFSVHMAP